MPSLEVRLLGGLDVRVGGEPLPPIPRAGRWLLSYLLLHRSHPVSRDRTAATFWPDLDGPRARRRLSHTLWQIQDTLGEHPAAEGWLVTDPSSLRLAPDRAWIDVEEFERRLERLRPSSGPVPDWRQADLADLAETVELYRGDLLPDVDEGWASADRERLAQLHLDALTWLVSMCKSQGAYEEALTYARRVTHLEPLREDAHQEVMRLCTLLGRPSDALRQYERVESVLREELGTAPARETQALRAFIAQQREISEPVLPAGEPAPSLRLVGRDRERRTGVAALERALGGDASVVLVEGEPGIGKSRLAEELVDAARWRGFTVLLGTAPPGVRRPYGPLRSALEHELTPVRIEQLRPHVDPVWLRTAAGVLPHLGRAGRLPDVGRMSGRDQAMRVREALARTILGLAAVDPVLLVLEDLHEADAETLDVVERLVRGLGRQPLSVLVTFRSAEARHRPEVWRALRLIDEAVAPDRIDLAPLTSFGVAELARSWMGTAPPSGLTSRLFRETGGNPLFALETLLSLEQTGHLESAADGVFPVAGSVREAVASRLEGLDAGAREVLRAAALQPTGTDIELLIEALEVELDATEVADTTGALVARGLLLEDQEGLRFRHEVLRRTVEDDVPEAEARRLHRSVARALGRLRPDRHADLAHHLEAAGDAPGAARAHHAAGRDAMGVHAYVTAAEHLRTARRLGADGPMSVRRRRELLTDLETVLDTLGERSAQADVLSELAAITSADDPDIARREARLAWSTDDLDRAESAARRAVAAARSVDLRLEAATVLARALQAAGDPEGAVDTLRAALLAAADDGTAAEVPAVAARARAHLALGAILADLGRYDDAEAHLGTALQLGERIGDVRTVADARSMQGAVRSERGDRAGALPAFTEALERCRELGYRYGEAVALVNLARTAWDRPATALEHLDTAVTAFRELGNERGAAIALVNRAYVRHLDVGDDAGAAADAAAAGAFFRRAGDDASAAIAAAVEALAAASRGDLPRARALVEDTPEPSAAWARVELATAAARVALVDDDPAVALVHARAAARVAEEHGAEAQLMANLPTLVDALLATGAVEEAVRVSEVVEGADPELVERPHRLWWARHRALAAAGDTTGAGAALQQAVALLEALLDTLPRRLRSAAERPAPHAAILSGVPAADTPPVLRLRLAAADAPTGRQLHPDELVTVEVDVPGGPGGDRADREAALTAIVAAAEAAGAVATVQDLAAALDVSVSTVRRDLERLRRRGVDLPTRGRRSG